jgi:hypothetical protein
MTDRIRAQQKKIHWSTSVTSFNFLIAVSSTDLCYFTVFFGELKQEMCIRILTSDVTATINNTTAIQSLCLSVIGWNKDACNDIAG